MAKIAAPVADEVLYQYLKDNEYVELSLLDKAVATAKQQQLSLYEALLYDDSISDRNLGKVVAEQLQMPFIVLSEQDIPEDILRLLPEKVAERQQLVVFGQTDDAFKVATAQQSTAEAVAWLEQKLGKKLQFYFATPYDVKDALKRYKNELAATFEELLKQKMPSENGSDEELPIAEIVETFITYAYENKASDIHIEPRKDGSIVRFRIDGVLHDVLTFPRALHDQIVTRIKVSAKLRTDEHLSAQDGKFRSSQQEELDIRVSILPVVGGEKVVMRLLSSSSREFGLVDLGMTDKDLEKVKASFSKPYGMILSTGPTGSGKTTTMYAILKVLNVRERNIATIEDPVEYEIEGINQIQVNTKTNLTFAHGLRSILRQDPNVLYVGEIRDEETADIAVNSATTGHLVLSTLHTNNAAGALPRLLDMNIEPFLIASTVNTVIAQRLVRKICDTCKVSVTTKKTELEQFLNSDLVDKYFGSASEVRTYKGKGCPVCYNTGYRGRIGIFEILVISNEIQTLITEKAASDAIETKAREEGMTTMLEDGLQKVQQGLTTVEEVLIATKE
jgi:type IV pilus assembly protein PilB